MALYTVMHMYIDYVRVYDVAENGFAASDAQAKPTRDIKK